MRCSFCQSWMERIEDDTHVLRPPAGVKEVVMLICDDCIADRKKVHERRQRK